MERKEYTIELLLEYYKLAREELLNRLKWRDNWLKYQLLVIIVLIALSIKMEFLSFKTNENHPELLLLCYPISVILCALYYTEDNIIGKLSSYSAAICIAEKDLNGKSKTVLNWDYSLQLRDFSGNALKKRFFAQIIVFILCPLIITIQPLASGAIIIEFAIGWILYILLLFVCMLFNLWIIFEGRTMRIKDRKNPLSIIV